MVRLPVIVKVIALVLMVKLPPRSPAAAVLPLIVKLLIVVVAARLGQLIIVALLGITTSSAARGTWFKDQLAAVAHAVLDDPSQVLVCALTAPVKNKFATTNAITNDFELSKIFFMLSILFNK